MPCFATWGGASVQNALAVLRIKQIGGLLCAKILHRCPAFGKARQLGNGHGLGKADGVIIQNFAV